MRLAILKATKHKIIDVVIPLKGTVVLVAVHVLTVAIAHTFDFPYEFEVNTAALSLSSALLVGIGAGFPPALRASQLDPVKVRSE